MGSAGLSADEYPELREALLKNGKSKMRLSVASSRGSEQPGAPGASSSSDAQQPAQVGASVSFMRRGPPQLPRIPETIVDRRPGESEQEYKCRVVHERYLMVMGETPE